MRFVLHTVTYQKHFKWSNDTILSRCCFPEVLKRAKCILAVEYLLINFSVTIFSDYSGLFQIKSSDDDSTTVGTPLVYGQVFKLVTVKVCFLNLLCVAFWSDTCYTDNIRIKMYFFLVCKFKSNIEMTRLFNLAYILFNLTNEELNVFIVL